MTKAEKTLLTVLKKRVSPEDTIKAVEIYYRTLYGRSFMIHVFDAGVIEVMNLLLSIPVKSHNIPIYTRATKMLALKGLMSHFAICATKAATKVSTHEYPDRKRAFIAHYIHELIDDIFMRNIAFLIGHQGVVNLNSLEVRLAGIYGYLEDLLKNSRFDSIISDVERYHAINLKR
ncbi:hypothetical protein [Bdellovibrio sp. BCCA]|uniref:hypothetical protein n=1 Tax=Bdellovibrio sp. BCCA TaxID=3136281 RepID=UPI0030F30621